MAKSLSIFNSAFNTMARISPFTPGQLMEIARKLGECATGSEISRLVFEAKNVQDRSEESTKWRRLYWYLQQAQGKCGCGDPLLDLIKTLLDPARFVDNPVQFEYHRRQINAVLALMGWEYGEDGKFKKIKKAKTLDEAHQRAQTLAIKLSERQLHPAVLKYARAELLQENYFHAVFEACKGLAQRIRDLTGLKSDGARLITNAFEGKAPKLRFNSLKTDTEKSQHNGFVWLLKGCFSAVRNPRAHAPKVLWAEDAEEAADYLTLISLLHYKLDKCKPFIARGGKT